MIFLALPSYSCWLQTSLFFGTAWSQRQQYMSQLPVIQLRWTVTVDTWILRQVEARQRVFLPRILAGPWAPSGHQKDHDHREDQIWSASLGIPTLSSSSGGPWAKPGTRFCLFTSYWRTAASMPIWTAGARIRTRSPPATAGKVASGPACAASPRRPAL